MRILALALVLCTSCACAIAQTTNTDCQVIGNQISCRSRTTSSPPFAPVVNPPATAPAPLLTPGMATLIAERNRAAAEAMRRDVERFTAELSSHDAWVSLKTGNSYHVRMSGDRIYLMRIVPPGESWSLNIECSPAQSPPGTWSCITYTNVRRFTETQMFRRNKICLLETKATLSAVSLDRITGESDTFGPKDVDWGKCKVKKVSRALLTLIPRGLQQ